MLFGRKPEPEPLPIAQLKGFVNAAFDSKLESFSRNAETSRQHILKSEAAFIAACERFRGLDAEPDFEGMLPVNVTYISSRKAAYADALKQHVLSSRRDYERHTKYHSYLEALTQAEEAIASINSTNSVFRQVFLAYAANLGDLKKAFSEMERGTKRLKADIENVREDADAYTEIMIKSDATEGLILELAALDSLEAELSGTANSGTAAESLEPRGLLDAKMAELEAVEKRVVAEASALKNMMMPIGRIARKYDHGAVRRRRLSDMVTHPELEMATDKDYEEFTERLRDLLKSIGNGSIDSSGDESVVNDINGILAKDMRAYVQAYKSATSDRSAIERQVSELKKEAEKARKERLTEEKRVMQLQELKERGIKAKAEIHANCAAIDALVLKHYRKRVTVTV